jgi:FHS family L-fucose permease-like MFS transporter
MKNSINYTKPFITMVVLFFIVGFLTVVNQQFQTPLKAALLQKAGEIINTLTVLITFVWFLAYPLTGSLGTRWIDKYGYKGTLVRGLGILIIGLLIFELAVFFHVNFPFFISIGKNSVPVGFFIFLAGSYIVGMATAVLQIVINPYLVACTVKGTSEIQRQMIGGSGNSIGTTLAPFFVSGLVFGGLTFDKITLNQLIIPFFILIAFICITMFIINRLNLPQIEETTNRSGAKLEKNIWSFSHLAFGVIAIFFYVGVEVSIGANINLFAESLGGKFAENAVKMAGIYWGGMLVGRIISSTISKISANVQLTFSAFMSIIFVTLSIIFKNPWLLVCVGFFHSVMWSSIFTLSINKLGKYTSKASGTLMIGVIGGALLPLLQGIFADYMHGDWTFTWIIVLFGEIYLLYYGLFGYKVKQEG